MKEKMKILLTGSSGFIGSHITPLLEKNNELYHLKSDLLNWNLKIKTVNILKEKNNIH
jgi:nucleoside-diphosphate-sugar epimerase